MNDIDRRSQTTTEFCQSEHISKATFYDLRKRGLAPEVLEVPGTKIKRITSQARETWRARMAELAKAEATQLEAERRRELAAIAGRIAARSPKHISKRARVTALPPRRLKADIDETST
jgi:hypothetical protein